MQLKRLVITLITVSCVSTFSFNVVHGAVSAVPVQNLPEIGFTTAISSGEDSYLLASKAGRIEFDTRGIKLHQRSSGCVSINFIDSKSSLTLEPFNKLAGAINILKGAERSDWKTSQNHYSSLAFRNVWDKVDVVFHKTASALKYDILLDPGAEISKIGFRINGADSVQIDPEGNLVITSAGIVYSDKRPIAWQVIDGKRISREASYRLEENRLFFTVRDYNSQYPLIIDPATDMSWGTFLGGEEFDSADEVFVDSAGYIYVTGESYSTGLAGTDGAYDANHQDTLVSDAFVAKLSPDGKQLIFLTFLGGNIDDYGNGLAVDADGNVYVAGYSDSWDFPTTPGAFQTAHAGNLDAFISKLNPLGSELIWSTYLGGVRNDDWAYGIVLDASGNVCVAGQTGSQDFPTVPGSFDTTYNGAYDAFITKIAANGGSLIFSTFIGGLGPDWAKDIEISPAGSLYIAGTTGSTDFPKPNAADNTLGGSYDAFALRLDSTGGTIGYGTYIGGAGNDVGNAIALDSFRNAYITGSAGTGFSTTAGAYDTSFNGGLNDVFVAKVSTGGNSIIYSTLLGGSGDDNGYAIEVTSGNEVYVTGSTHSANFPITPDAFDTSVDTNGDGFLTRISADGSLVGYSAAFGGTSVDTPIAMDLSPDGAPVISGFTFSSNFPVTTGAYDTTFNVNGDMFIVKFFGTIPSDTTPPTIPVVSDEGLTTTSTDSLTATWSSTDPESGISNYEYAIGTTASDPGSGYVKNWTSTGIMPGVTATALPLQSGTTYYFYVRATNGLNLVSPVGVSDGILVVSFTGLTPGEAKLKADNVGLSVTGVVTAIPSQMGGSRLYIEAPGRSSGLAIASPSPVTVGQTVEASGTMSTVNGERVLASATVAPGIIGTPLVPVTTICKTFASRDWFYNSVTGAGQRGVDTPSPMGTTTIGLLIRLTGNILAEDSSYLYISDGGYGNGQSLKVSKMNLSGAYSIGQHIVVTGISSMEFDGSNYNALLIPRGDADIVVEAP